MSSIDEALDEKGGKSGSWKSTAKRSAYGPRTVNVIATPASDRYYLEVCRQSGKVEELSVIPLDITREYVDVEPWMHVLYGHCNEVYRHSVLVGELTVAFTAYLGLSAADQSLLTKAALLHDVGKLKISRELLRKPAALTPQETAEMRLHPEHGHRLLAEHGGFEPEVLAVVLQHHERLDGSGYPRGLCGSDLSEPVRLITLCDVYAAITEERPYERSYTTHEALEIMARKKARLDLRLLEHFSSMARTVLTAPALS